MIYNNLEEIIKEFELKEKNPEKIRKELRKMAANLHPDKTTKGERFKTKEDKKRYNRINQAIDFIDNMSNETGAIVPVPLTQLTDFIEATKQITSLERQSNLNNELSHQIEKSVKDIKLKHRFPKISLATLTGILTLIWLFPNQIHEHQIIGKYIDIYNPLFTLLWTYVLLLTIILWVFYWKKEQRYEKEISKLKVESYQNKLFDSFINEDRYFEQFHDKFHNKGWFSKEDFIDYLTNHYYRYKVYRHKIEHIIYNIKIDLETTQNLANSIFSRFEKKNVIKKVDSKSFSDYFIFNKNISTET